MTMGRDSKAREAAKKVFSGPPFDNAKMMDYQSYEERFSNTMERTAKAVELLHDPKNRKLLMQHTNMQVQMQDLYEVGELRIHFVMSLNFIKNNASEEQQRMWLGMVHDASCWVAYAQTELGHGSNLRGLETTATFDADSDEFVIDSPTLTSMKFWPSGMYACTHGIVFAQLMISGKNHGVHGFWMQFRDDQGHLMPGVEVGEMGPKIHSSNTNIGYARFDHVRVPRSHMFSKFQQVTREGQYIAPPRLLSKFGSITMMNTRMLFIASSGFDLAKAACIAVRYSCVRTQGFKDSTVADPLGAGIGEHAIIEYQMQQYRLFKCLAYAYMIYLNSVDFMVYVMQVQSDIAGDDDERRNRASEELQELHATLSGIKALGTVLCGDGAEDCRRACGGQGYLKSSGVAGIVTSFSIYVTGEGEQVILSLQTARFLIKAAAEVRAGRSVAGSVEYLADEPLRALELQSWRGETETMIALLRDRARRYSFKLEAAFRRAESSGLSFDEALNSVAVLACEASEHHSFYIMARNFRRAIDSAVTDPSVRTVLARLLDLAVLMQLRERAGTFLGLLSDDHLDLAMERINELLAELRPDCVGLADSFGFTDEQLKSTLGRFDGCVYEAIYEEAKLSPLNQTSKMVGWDHLAPILDLDFLRDGKLTQRAGAVAVAERAGNVAEHASADAVPRSAL